MSGVSYLMAAYLAAVSSAYPAHYAETRGLHPEALAIEYGGYHIGFEYQHWRIIEASVCKGYSHDLAIQADCTLKAKSMFAELCSALSSKPINSEKYIKTRNMYCHSASAYRPIIAQVTKGIEDSALTRARQACHAATIEAMGAGSAALIAARDSRCRAYRAMEKTP